MSSAGPGDSLLELFKLRSGGVAVTSSSEEDSSLHPPGELGLTESSEASDRAAGGRLDWASWHTSISNRSAEVSSMATRGRVEAHGSLDTSHARENLHLWAMGCYAEDFQPQRFSRQSTIGRTKIRRRGDMVSSSSSAATWEPWAAGSPCPSEERGGLLCDALPEVECSEWDLHCGWADQINSWPEPLATQASEREPTSQTTAGKPRQAKPSKPRKRPREHWYICGYCKRHKSSASSNIDGRVRIRCECGGQHQDGKPRMHATWSLVESPPPSPPGSPSSNDTEALWTEQVSQQPTKRRAPPAVTTIAFVDSSGRRHTPCPRSRNAPLPTGPVILTVPVSAGNEFLTKPSRPVGKAR